MTSLPEVRIGDPIRHEALAVFPLFASAHVHDIAYLLSDEALAAGSVTVEEVSEGGSVPHLVVKNDTDSRVLFLEGEELRGAKQNRVLNTSVLVGAHARTVIPVSCVERGRWHYRTHEFRSEGTHASSKLRHYLKSSVSRSLQAGAGYKSDQMAVWAEVDRVGSSLGTESDTSALSDTFESYSARRAEFRERLKYVEGAAGVAVAVGDRVVALDVFDKPATCRKVWDRLLSGVVLDALETPPAEKPAEPSDVHGLLDRIRAASWEPAPPIGEGQEFRADADATTHASALLCEQTVLHGSVVVAS
jgi:hypothetical protein